MSIGRRVGKLMGRLQRRPYLMAVLRWIGALIAGFCLAQLHAMGTYVPVAPACLAAIPFSVEAVFLFAGAAFGYLTGWGITAALEPLATCFLILAGSCIFHDLPQKQRRWFLPMLSCAVYAMLGLVMLVGSSFALLDTARTAMRIAILWFCSRGFLKTAEGDHTGYAMTALCVLAVFSSITIWPGFPVSVLLCSVALLLYAQTSEGLLYAAGCGLMLQLTCQTTLPITAVFCASACVLKNVNLIKPIRAGLYVLLFAGAIALFDGADAEYIVAVLVGAVIYICLPETLIHRVLSKPAERDDAVLEQAAELFRGISRSLSRGCRETRKLEPAAVFDQAAEQLCTNCSGFPACWQRCGEHTCRELSSVSGLLARNGMLDKRDLPRSFLERCIQPEEFCAAVNRAMEQQRARLQCLSERRQLRQIACSQYGYLAELMQRLAEPAEEAAPQFLPEVGVCACSRQGQEVSGDQGTQFICHGQLFLLLCDGMGTGSGADLQARQAVSLLRQMLMLGFEPLEAMNMLNDLYLLKGDGAFSTVDLLQVDLADGTGFLHKWGAAASFVCSESGIRSIGTATLPPGLDVGETHRTVCVRLSLRDGEQVILTTDGIQTDECKHFLEGMGEATARELAAGIVAAAGGQGDDRTAVVVRLHRLQGQRYHTTVRERSLSK